MFSNLVEYLNVFKTHRVFCLSQKTLGNIISHIFKINYYVKLNYENNKYLCIRIRYIFNIFNRM